MKRQVLKTLFCLSLSAAIVLGESGAAMAEALETPVEASTEMHLQKSLEAAENENVTATEEGAETETDEAADQDKADGENLKAPEAAETEAADLEAAEKSETDLEAAEKNETDLEVAEKNEMDLEAAEKDEADLNDGMETIEDADAVGEKIVASNTLAGSVVTGLSFNSVTRLLSWNKVKNATEYKIEIFRPNGKLLDTEWSYDEAYYTIGTYYGSYVGSGYEIPKGSIGSVRVTAYNKDELYLVASNVTDTSKYSDSSKYKIVWKTGMAATVYAYPATAQSGPLSIGLNPVATNELRVSALSGFTFKEITEDSVIFTVAPATIQKYERVVYQYANNPSYNEDGLGQVAGGSSVSAGENGILPEISIPLNSFMAGDTLYVKARVYNSSYEGNGSSYSAYVSSSYKIPAAEMKSVYTTVTNNSIRLIPSCDGQVTGFCYQKKNGKKWIDLASQPDMYTDKSLIGDKKYTYRVRGYIYNSVTKKTTYTNWKTVSAYTWGSSLNLKGNAKSSTSVKLSWNKVAKAEGYEVYRVEADSYSSNYLKGDGVESFDNALLVKTIKKAKTKTYTDKKLASGSKYRYFVRAYRTVGKNKYYIEEGVDVSLAANGEWSSESYYMADGSLMVTWQKRAGISGYKVEKYNKATEKYVAYKTLGKGAVSVKLPKVSAGNGSESYRIRPYKGKKFYSGASFSVDPTLPAVKNVKAVQTAEGISVTWSPVAGADYYEVYRARQDSFTYDKTTKTYQVNAGYLPKVVEANFKDTSAGVSLLPVSSSVQYGYTYSSINPALWEAAANNDGAFYEGVSSYSASKIKGTSVVDKMISVKSLIHKSDLDANYDSDKDTEKTSWPYKEYVKEANGALKTKTAVIVAGPQAGTQYFYFVKAFAKASNGANENNELTESVGFTKAASVLYTKVAAAKSTKVSSAKSSKKASVTIKIKKASGAKGYAVYRSTKKGKGYVQIGTATKPTYTDNDVVGGKTYYYKVAPYKLSETGTFIYSKMSSAKKIKVKK